MARASGGGSRFASANLNDLYGKQVQPGGGGISSAAGGKSRYGTTHGGMLVLARPVRTPPSRPKPAPPKLTVPAPVNLPSLRKEHAGNDPNITLVGGSGVSGWSKQQQQSLVEDPAAGDGSGPLRSNGWGVAQPPHSQESAPTDGQLRPGKYTPPGARGNTMQVSIRPVPPPVVVLRGEDFPTLQAAVPLNPVPPQQRQRELQQRQREKQQEIKQQQQKMQQLSQNRLDKEQAEDRYTGPSVLALQPQAKQEQAQRFLREEPHLLQKHMDAGNQFPLKENRKPNDLSLRPGPLLHLNHTSNWADDERETASISKPTDWEEGPRFSTQAPFNRPTFQRDERPDRIGNARRDGVHSREGLDYGRSREMQDFGYREGYFGRNDFGRDRHFRSEVDIAREFNGSRDSRGNGWGRDVQRERDGYLTREGSYNRSRESFARDNFFNKTAPGDRGRFGGRNGAFDLPMDFGRIRSPGLSHGMSYSEDAFMRNFPELPNLDFCPDLKTKLRRKKEELNEAKFRDPERESFETELQRVQKEQEQERQRKIEERERAIELARKEQEERERLAREEEERQHRLEEEAREAVARAEQEALESSRKIEESKRAREEEKRRMLEEEEKRKENARRKLIELEERIAKREVEKKQNNVEGLSHHEVADRDDLPTKVNTHDQEDDDRAPLRFPRPMSSPLRSRVQQDSPNSCLRSPDVQGGYNTFSMGRESGSRGGDSERPRFSSSWRREPGDGHLFPHISQDRADGSVLRDHRLSDEAERFYGNLDGFSTADGLRRDRMSVEKWIPNGDPMRNLYSSRADAFMDHSFLDGSFNRDEDRRWNRRAREGRPFSPPSPTSYGGSYDAVEGFSYGRVRQSLPRQPRVPPPPLRIPLQRQSSSKIAEQQSASSAVFLSSDVQDNISGRGSETQPEEMPASNVQHTEINVVEEESFLEDERDSSTVPEVEEDTDLQGESESVVTTQLSFSRAFTSSPEEHNDKEQDEVVSDSTASIEMSEEEIAEIPAVEKHVVEIGEMDEGDFAEERTTHLQNSVDRFDLETENFEEEESMDGRESDAVEMVAELSELVDSLVVLQKGEDEQVSQLKIVDSGDHEESKKEEELVKDEVVAATQPQKPVSEPPALLPSPLQTTQPGPRNGQHHTFHQQAAPTYVPSQFPLLEPRPRLQTHPDRPMTLQFGLLPGTSLLQGSVPAIQIGSIQMPLQLHPPMGHHVTHLQPPQFQFGQIGQQTNLLQSVPSFTVHHPQPMLQRPILNMDGQPTPHSQQGFPPQHFQTFWAHQFGQGSHGQVITDEKNALSDKDEKQSKDAMDGTSQDSKAQLEPVHLAVPKNATDELMKVPESSVQDSWKAYSDEQVSTSFGTGFQAKGNAKHWPLQARKSGPQEAHFSSDNSFRKKPNRRGNSDFRSPNAERGSHYVPRRSIKVDDNGKALELDVDNMFPREVGKAGQIAHPSQARNLEKNGSVEGLFDAPGAFEQPGARNDEDDFIEVRSKRQMLNDRREQKEKQVKGKPKYMKVKEQAAPKQRNVAKPVSQVGSSRQSNKNESLSLQNHSFDIVSTTTRTTQVSLPNPEVVFEKRTKSPQPSQINPPVSEAPSYPSLVAETSPGISAAPAAWGFNRANPEVVSLTQIQLEEAMKPVRFEVPIPQQQLPENLSTAVETAPSVTVKDKGPGPAAAPGPINSLLAGEKIQFGAVTMPAYVSSITWPLSSSLGAVGSSRSEGFLAGRKDLPHDENELVSFNKGKRSRENDDGNSNCIDSEAEAEAAASAIAVAAISNDDYVHSADQHVPSHGVIGSASANKSSPVASNGMAVQNPRSTTQSSGMDDTMSVSLPADLSVDPPLPLRGPPHSGQLMPSIPGAHSSFPGMGTILGGPVFAFSSAGDSSHDSGAGLNTERPLGPNVGNWQPHHSGADSFYGGPPSYTGPFINHGPIPSIPPHTLVYTSPFGGVGQFGQLGVSYMGPTQMPSVKQPDWKHTPVSATSAGISCMNSADGGGLGGGMPYPQHNNRHLGHDPSVIPVVPHGPFDIYRDMAFQVSNVDLAMQSQWSHMPGPHLPSAPMSGPIPGFPMQLRHPPPMYHMQQHTDCISESHLTSAVSSASVEATDQFPDELGLGDSMSLNSDAGSSFAVQQASGKTPSLVSSLPAGSKLRSRVVQPTLPEVASSRPSTANGGVRVSVSTSSVSSFQSHAYAATASSPRRAIGHADKRNSPQQSLSKMAAGPAAGWSSQGRKGGGSQGRSQAGERGPGGEKSNAKLKQVYVAKTSSLGLSSNDSSSSEIFTAEARHM